MIIKESSLKKGLPKKTPTICPECKKVIVADIYEKDGKVMISKTCDEHGYYEDIYWSDVELYLKAQTWAYDGIGVENPALPVEKGCPFDCGLCPTHTSHTSLANLDLTNRCNLKCPICFANANDAGYVYEPSFDQVVSMMETLRAERPVPCTAIQFAGGEPTIYPHLFDVISKARDLGFAQIQIATNGLLMARKPGFTKKMQEAGMHTIYLQFDGLREENYIAARGVPLLKEKLAAIESCRIGDENMSVVLVPTIINGINDDQVGEIVKFAIENRDVVRSVNFQPVAFTGRIDLDERLAGRFTLPDLVDRMEKQTGITNKDDWFPVPVVTPVSEFMSVISGEPKVAFTPHPNCGLATYIFIDKEGNSTPITRFVDVEGLMKEIYTLAQKSEGKKMMLPVKLKAFDIIKKHFHADKAPEGLNVTKFLKLLQAAMSTGSKDKLADFAWDMMMIGGMHFQDDYNYDIERVKRCVIHYVTPDNLIIPFCAYNGGPTYRTDVEKRHSIPNDEWRARHGGEGL